MAYGLDTLLTDLILQEARTEAKAQLFGKAEENVKYSEGMKSELEKNGHIVELLYMNRKETLRNVERLVIDEELLCVLSLCPLCGLLQLIEVQSRCSDHLSRPPLSRRSPYRPSKQCTAITRKCWTYRWPSRRPCGLKASVEAFTNGTLDNDERCLFWSTWKTDNYTLLVNQLGFKTQASRFLHGLFFMSSFLQKTVPELQTLFMADACHLNFGKYTIFACNGVTVNANMLPVGFALIFGNENGASWKEF